MFDFDYLARSIPGRFVRYLEHIYPEDRYCDKSLCDKMKALYHDWLKLRLDDDLMYYLIYLLVEQRFGLSDNNYEIDFQWFDKFFYNPDLRMKIYYGTWESQYFLILQELIPYFTDLHNFMMEQKSYMVVKKEKDIVRILNNEAIPKLSEDELKLEIDRRYFDTIYNYKIRMNGVKFIPLSQGANPTDFVRMRNGSVICKLLYKYLHKRMVNYYNRTGYIYQPIDDDMDAYYLNDIVMLTYHNDDLLKLTVNEANRSYGFNSYEFWAIINSPEFNQKFKHADLALKARINTSKDVIVAPTDYMDDVFFSYIKTVGGFDKENGYNIFLDSLLNKIGFPRDKEVSSDVLTQDERVFFKSPWNVDILKLKDEGSLDTLRKLRAKNKVEREKYIKRLISTFKGKQTNIAKKAAENQEVYKKRMGSYSKKSNKEWLD